MRGSVQNGASQVPVLFGVHVFFPFRVVISYVVYWSVLVLVLFFYLALVRLGSCFFSSNLIVYGVCALLYLVYSLLGGPSVLCRGCPACKSVLCCIL